MDNNKKRASERSEQTRNLSHNDNRDSERARQLDPEHIAARRKAQSEQAKHLADSANSAANSEKRASARASENVPRKTSSPTVRKNPDNPLMTGRQGTRPASEGTSGGTHRTSDISPRTINTNPDASPKKQSPDQQQKHAMTQDERLRLRKRRIQEQSKRRENAFRVFNISAVMVVFVFCTLFMTFGKRPTVSYEEFRDLNKCPTFTWDSYFKGEFTEKFAAFYNDTVPLRSTFKDMIASFRAIIGIPYKGGVAIVGDPIKPSDDVPPTANVSSQSTSFKNPVNTSSKALDVSGSSLQGASDISQSSSSSTQQEVPEQHEDGAEMSGSVLVLPSGRGMSLFGAGKSTADECASYMNHFKELLPDVDMYALIAPTAVSFYLPEEYKNASAEEKPMIDYLYSKLEGITPVDAYSVLSQHVNEDIYLKTDHHWTSLGAFYAAQEFARTANAPVPDLSTYEVETRDGFLGSMNRYSGYHPSIKNHPETFTLYKPTNSYTTDYYNSDMTNERTDRRLILNLQSLNASEYYLVFIGTDDVVTHVKTDCHNGRKLLMIKDSYGNALTANLTNSFEEIWVVDMRYFQKSVSEFCKEKEITDLLFMWNTFSAMGPNRHELPEIY